MKIIEEVPLFPEEEEQPIQPTHSEEWYTDVYNRFGLTKQDLDSTYKENKNAFNNEPLDYLDWDLIETFLDNKSLRHAKFKKNKDYLESASTIPRYKVNEYKLNGDNKADITIYLNPETEKLSEIIEVLPYGLIDKQITGIGATYLELHSNRNSIIVTPTRALALNKLRNKFLYVGSREGHWRATSKTEIKDYLNNSNYEYKKILVVADSIDKVIEAIQENKEDVYREYFLLVDEIDTLQSDNHFRPILSRVIDHYFKFKLQRRALLSATVREFTHPQLQSEPLTTIKSIVPIKRNIDLYHTNNINLLLAKKIIEISKEHPSDKILIAYNSVLNILQTIRLLTKELQDYKTCSILCSEASKDEAGNYLKTLVKGTNKLPCKINFMTCSYFAGVDIEDSYHLIAVSNSKKIYSALPLNKITQIYGRCRITGGVLSDIILYNNTKKPLRSLDTYRDTLSKKAEKVIDLLEAAKTLKKEDKDLEDLFSRIHKVIIERATERLFEQQSFELVRDTIDKKLEISYFNIDALCEKMEAYCKFYFNKEGLYNHLKEIHLVNMHYDESDNEDNDTEEVRDAIKEETNQRLLNKLSNIKDELISVSQANALNSDYLDEKINSSKRKEEEFYKRIKTHYKYYDITFLANILSDSSLKNKKYYRNLNNTFIFRALEDTHPFKSQVHQNFQRGKKYSSEEIARIFIVIVKDQIFKTLPMRYSSQSGLMNLFKSCVESTYTGGKYLIKGYKPKFNNVEIPEPIRKISENEYAIDYFDISNWKTNNIDIYPLFK